MSSGALQTDRAVADRRPMTTWCQDVLKALSDLRGDWQRNQMGSKHGYQGCHSRRSRSTIHRISGDAFHTRDTRCRLMIWCPRSRSHPALPLVRYLRHCLSDHRIRQQSMRNRVQWDGIERKRDTNNSAATSVVQAVIPRTSGRTTLPTSMVVADRIRTDGRQSLTTSSSDGLTRSRHTQPRSRVVDHQSDSRFRGFTTRSDPPIRRSELTRLHPELAVTSPWSGDIDE